MFLKKYIFKFLVIQMAMCLQQEKCEVLKFPHLKDDTIWISEKGYVNLTFALDLSGCKTANKRYTVNVKIKINKNNTDDEGRLAVTNGICNVTAGKLLRCISPVGPVELIKKVNRSHCEIESKWRWNEIEYYEEGNKTLKIRFIDPPSVINMTVDEQEVNGAYIINKGRNVSIFCAFKKGNPPVPFRLLYGNGKELAVARDEKHVIHLLLAVQCEENWPVVRCEGKGSTQNRSALLLVRCPPEFTDVAPKFVDLSVKDHVSLNIKSHVKNVSRCLLIPGSPVRNSSREVSCSLDGNPPKLILTVHFEAEEKSIRGNWTLSFTNEIGTGKIILAFIGVSGDDPTYAIIIGPLSGAAILTITILLVATLSCRKQKCGEKLSSSDDSREMRDNLRESMIVNNLYGTNSDGGLLSRGDIQNDNHVSRANCDTLVFHQRPPLTSTEQEITVIPLRSGHSDSPGGESSGYIASTMETEIASTSGCKKTKELIYRDLDFSHKKVTDFIIGSASATEYADINSTAIVPPLRDYK